MDLDILEGSKWAGLNDFPGFLHIHWWRTSVFQVHSADIQVLNLDVLLLPVWFTGNYRLNSLLFQAMLWSNYKIMSLPGSWKFEIQFRLSGLNQVEVFCIHSLRFLCWEETYWCCKCKVVIEWLHLWEAYCWRMYFSFSSRLKEFAARVLKDECIAYYLWIFERIL